MTRSIALAVALVLTIYCPPNVDGHGRLVEPPSRSSMWRFGFKTKPNYNDNELFCGGYTVHWQRNGGKCGVCGDAWHIPPPRPNEAGGTYGKGIIVRKYSPGQVITSTVEITANHRGFFEFKLCPHNNPSTVVTQECLDKVPLQLADNSGYQYYPSFGTGPFNVKLKLPQQLTCSQCVFQWTYTAGNNWGTCENGTAKVGCGPQETFRGCADVAIGHGESNDIPFDGPNPQAYSPSISVIPPRRPSARPSYQWSRPTKPDRRKKPSRRPAIKPYYTNRGSIPSNKKPSTKRPKWQNYPRQRDPTPRTTRRTTPRPRTTRRTTPRPRTTRRTTPRPRTTRRTTPRPRTTRRTTPRPQYTPKLWYSSTTKKTTYRPWYSNTSKRPPHRPVYTNKPNYPKQRPNKKSKPSRRPKPTTKKTYDVESENVIGGCRAVGAWQSVSGIANWCNVNCPRGYCPPSHCDCS